MLTVHVRPGKPKDAAARTLARLKQRARATGHLHLMEYKPRSVPKSRTRRQRELERRGMHVEGEAGEAEREREEAPEGR